MLHTLCYTYKAEIEDLEEYDIDIYYEDYAYQIYENFKDIFPYLFQEKYHIPYNELSWHLEEGALEMYRELENKWLNNELDTFTLYHDEDFLTYLKKLYVNEVLGNIEREVIDYISNSSEYTITEVDDLFSINNSIYI